MLRMRFHSAMSKLLSLLAVLAIGGAPLLAQNAKEQLNAIIRDTQKQGNRAGRVELVWWVPPEFWRATMQAAGTVPVDKVEEMVKAISDVNVFIVFDGKVGALGQMDFVPQAELQKTFSLLGGDGKAIASVPENKQSTATKNLLGIMKPILANMLGQLGQNIVFFVFDGKAKDGSRLIDPNKPGSFVAKLGEEEFKWRLPLGSLLPDKTCPKCKETFAGNYAFCPFDATPLVAVKAADKK